MKKTFTFLFFTLFMTGFISAQIVITEIQYNHPSWDDDEFVEFYNNSGSDIQMEGYYIGDGFDFIFPEYNFEADTYLVITLDKPSFTELYGIPSLQWDGGTISNSGEDISLYAADSTLVDYVDFEDNSGGWSPIADGFGHSLSLCDIDADNEDPNNWEITIVDAPLVQGRRMSHASPGASSTCIAGPIVVTSRVIDDLIEGAVQDTASFFFDITNTNGMPSSLSVSVDPTSTASPDDYEILESTIEFSGMVDTFVSIRIVTGADDAIAEGKETLKLNVTVDSNVEEVANASLEITIIDDDNPLEEGLLLVGIFEASIVDANGDNIGSGDEFGVELYAVKDIPDLSIYGIGTANNGGGTDGIEIPLPAVSLTQGDRYFVTDSEARFTAFFGFAPDFTHPSIWVTGNDAVELFEHGHVIDTYGQIDVDGEGTSWEFDEGWAVRGVGTTADGATFVQDNWILSGIELLVGETNETALFPYPLNFYMPPVSVEDLALDLNLQLSPNPVKDVLYIDFDGSINNIDVFDISIYTIEGKLLNYTEITNGQLEASINVSDLAAGFYFASIKTSEGTVSSKFVK